MRRGRSEAGWSGRRWSGPVSQRSEVVPSWTPSREDEAIDLSLVVRLRATVFEDDGRRLRRSVRLSPQEPDDWFGEYLAVPEAFDDGLPLIVGWWSGEVAEAVEVLGEPEAEVPVVRGTDLDLAVWRVPRVHNVVSACGIPTLLATLEPGWVLVAPPSSDELFLYPEVAASD